MEDLKGRNFVRRKLKLYFVFYGAASALLLIALSSALLLRNYATSLHMTARGLSELKIGLSKARTTMKEVNSFLGQAHSFLPHPLSAESPSRYLYAGLDGAKAAVGKADLVIGKIEIKDDEAVMPVTITGPVNDYQAFVVGLGRLQEMRFPFFSVTNLTMKMGREEKSQDLVAYEIKGGLSMPQLNGDPESAGPKPERGDKG